MTVSYFTLDKSVDVEDVTISTSGWSPSWLAPISSEPPDKPQVRSSAPPAPFPSTPPRGGWKAELRAWPKSRRDEWADLVEQGEDEGLPSREAEELAFVIASAIEVQEPPPPPSRFFDGWVPDLSRDMADPRDGGRRPLPRNPARPIWLKIPSGLVVPLGDKHQARASSWCEEGTDIWYRLPTPVEVR